MRKFYLLPLALLSSSFAFAGEDPLCDNHKGMAYYNPMGRNALEKIRECIPIYCDPAVNIPNLKINLKHIDSRLEQFQSKINEFKQRWRALEDACGKLVANIKQTEESPEMKEYRSKYFAITYTMQELSDLKASMTHDPELGVISDTGDITESKLNKPSCKKQINSILTSLIEKTEAFRTQSEFTCKEILKKK